MTGDTRRFARVPVTRAALACRCPRCGEGRLFTGLLTVRAACPACGLDLSAQDAGDGEGHDGAVAHRVVHHGLGDGDVVDDPRAADLVAHAPQQPVELAQGVLGESATNSGVILTPMMVGFIFSSIVGGQLLSRTGRYKVLAIFGFAVTAIGMFLLSRMAVTTAQGEIIRNMIIRSRGFGFEVEVTAKVAKLKCAVYEVPISYYGRTYEEGKKISYGDGFVALWLVFRFNLFCRLRASFHELPNIQTATRKRPSDVLED